MSGSYPAKLELREVGPRDGFQNIRDFIPTVQKIAVIKALVDAGLSEIEVTSFVSPKVIPQMADAEDVMDGLAGMDFVRSVLVPTPKRAEQAIASGAEQLVVFLSGSEAHNKANVNRTISESLAGLETIFRLADAARVPVVGAVAVAFGCPYEGAVERGSVLNIAQRFIELGSAGVIFGDTTGMANPQLVTAIIKGYQDQFSDNIYSLHFHNNRGTAMVNLMAAMEAGANRFDTALGGTGGCPTVPKAAGNLATEDVVGLMDEIGVETGINLNGVITAARDLEESIGQSFMGQVMRSGAVDWHPGRKTTP